ncbi:hypothetical protein [Nostoc sphaeroides]|uniref:Uncharacterized protein n=1 Tax=Nostoc sphaeroides CCNUC1 TaxID=2653204 RepID=A0A5P8WH40_9NOSO|nr:hypothetical protein [Nostoc sphaeroides]QFS51930.1 hypothetical protein GXM_09424 [Nostoc sphaeroides CCNUC1]
MANFQVVIEGKGAVAAATELKELLAETGLSGTVEVPDEEKRRADPIEAIILTFALNVAASVVADRINEFIRKHDRNQDKNQIEYVLLIRDDKRHRIDFPFDEKQDTSEEIREVLEDEDS